MATRSYQRVTLSLDSPALWRLAKLSELYQSAAKGTITDAHRQMIHDLADARGVPRFEDAIAGFTAADYEACAVSVPQDGGGWRRETVAEVRARLAPTGRTVALPPLVPPPVTAREPAKGDGSTERVGTDAVGRIGAAMNRSGLVTFAEVDRAIGAARGTTRNASKGAVPLDKAGGGKLLSWIEEQGA